MTKIGTLCRHKKQERWYVRVNGKQCYLGNKTTTEDDARTLYKALVAEIGIKDRSAEENDAEAKLGGLIGLYLDHAGSVGCKKNQLSPRQI
jgi:hypothetical protein